MSIADIGELMRLARIARANGGAAASLTLFESAVKDHPRHVGARLELANDLRALDRLDEAAKIYSEVLAETPQQLGALIGLAFVARRAGNRAESLRLLSAAAEAHPDHDGAKLELAADLAAVGRPDEAEAVYRRMIEKTPPHAGAFIGLAQLARRRGDRESALQMFRAAAVADPRHAGAPLEVANELRELSRFDEAEAAYRRILDSAPLHVGALMGIAHLARRRGDRNAALQLFQEAASADPNHGGAQLEVANELRELLRLREAEAAYRSILDRTPRHVGALMGLAHLARRQFGPGASLTLFQEAAEADPHNAGPQLEIANDLRELWRLDEAEAICRRVLEEAPRHVGALMGLAHIVRRRDGRRASLPLFESASQADPGHTGAALEIAHDLRELSRLDEADAAYRQILDRNPAQVEALLGLGHLARRRQGRFGSLALFQAAAASDPNHMGARLEAANDLRELMRFEAAEAAYRRILDDATAPPIRIGALIGLALLARRRGHRAEALAHCQAATDADPAHVGAKLEYASELGDLGRTEEASRLVRAILAAEPANLQARMHLGYLARRAGERMAAFDAFRQVHDSYPNHIPALLEMALEERALGRPLESERTLQRAIDLDPHHLGALMALAEHALLAEDYDDALALCDRATASYPGNLPPRLLASRALVELGRREDAVASLDRAGEVCGPQPEIAVRRVEILKQTGAREAARLVLDEAERSAAGHFGLRGQRIQLDLEMGDFDAVTGSLAAISAGSMAERAQIELYRGQLAAVRWDLEAAAEHYLRSLALNPNHAGAHTLLAKVRLLLLDLDGTLDSLKSSVRLNTSATLLRGESLNVAQSHLGQLLDDFRIDREAHAALRAICDIPLAGRIEPLRQMIRQNPDLTSAAICLLVALRRAKLLRGAPAVGFPDEATPLIPAQIVQYWDAPAPPDDIKSLMQSWPDLHPRFGYRRFDDQAARDFLRSTYPAEVSRAYGRAEHAAQKADIFRLAYLHAEGGFYADADDQCLASVRTIVPSRAAFAAYQEEFGTLGNNFLGAAPKDPVIARALELATEAVNRGDADTLWLTTGPGLVSRAFAQIASETPLDPAAWLERVCVLECYEMRRAIATHAVTSYKKTDKHWLRSAFRRRPSPTAAAETGARTVPRVLSARIGPKAPSCT